MTTAVERSRGLYFLAGYVRAIAIFDRARLRCLARELGAFEAHLDAFLEGASGNLAELVILRQTSFLAIWAFSHCHARTLLTSDPTDSDLHPISPEIDWR